jgi:hypothetical protein
MHTQYYQFSCGHTAEHVDDDYSPMEENKVTYNHLPTLYPKCADIWTNIPVKPPPEATSTLVDIRPWRRLSWGDKEFLPSGSPLAEASVSLPLAPVPLRGPSKSEAAPFAPSKAPRKDAAITHARSPPRVVDRPIQAAHVLLYGIDPTIEDELSQDEHTKRLPPDSRTLPTVPFVLGAVPFLPGNIPPTIKTRFNPKTGMVEREVQHQFSCGHRGPPTFSTAEAAIVDGITVVRIPIHCSACLGPPPANDPIKNYRPNPQGPSPPLMSSVAGPFAAQLEAANHIVLETQQNKRDRGKITVLEHICGHFSNTEYAHERRA